MCVAPSLEKPFVPADLRRLMAELAPETKG
jgi:hypothetical protein